MKFSAADEARILAMAGLPGGKVRGVRNPKGGLRAFDLPPGGLASPTRWSVTIDRWHPARVNEIYGTHHMHGARLKARDAAIVAGELFAAGVTKAAGKRIVRLHLVLGKGQRGGDPDAYWKSTLDALVNCGALVDDSCRWCECVPLAESDYSCAAERATRITLEDA